MNNVQLLETVEEMLEFRIEERQNDAILVRARDVNGKVSVRPANGDEVKMFLRLLGLAKRLDIAATAIQSADILIGVQDAKIKELLEANKGLAEERAFLAEVHTERVKSLSAQHDKGLIAAAERMQEEWLKRFEEKEAEFARMENAWRTEVAGMEHILSQRNSELEHATERAESAEEMAGQMNALLSSAQQELVESKSEVASLEFQLQNAIDDNPENEKEQA